MAKEMSAVEFLKKWERMCKQNGGKCALGCPLLDLKRESNKAICREAVMDGPEKAVVIVQKWTEEHPVKTMRKDFFEKFPLAPTINGRTPFACAKDCYPVTCYKEGHTVVCEKCWERPLPLEVEA